TCASIFMTSMVVTCAVSLSPWLLGQCFFPTVPGSTSTYAPATRPAPSPPAKCSSIAALDGNDRRCQIPVSLTDPLREAAGQDLHPAAEACFLEMREFVMLPVSHRCGCISFG